MMNRESDRERCVVLASYLVENRATVRATAQRFGISKSTVHKDVTEILRHVDRALYDEVSRVLATNKQERHLRGGEATRRKYRQLAGGPDARSRPAQCVQFFPDAFHIRQHILLF